VIHPDGVPVETSVVFGDRAVEIGIEAECFDADLVVMPPGRRGPGGAGGRARTAARRGAAALRARRPVRLGDMAKPMV